MKLREILDLKRTDTIVRIVSVLVTIASICVAIYLKSSSSATSAAGTKTDADTHWTRTDIYWMIIIGAIILSNGGYLAFYLVRRNTINKQVIEQLGPLHESYHVIVKLSALQASYILAPNFVTAEEHGKQSKEGGLSKGGAADILTNSLKYDMYFKDVISNNIIKGAKYIYVLPNTNSVLRDLRNYITTIRNSIHRGISPHHIDGSVSELETLCKANLEFWFFHGEIPCLYNFAIFRQHAEGESQPFDSYCWYINPSDDKPNSHMLAYTIQDTRDKSALDEVFGKLKKCASKKNGQEVYDNRDKLSEWIGGK